MKVYLATTDYYFFCGMDCACREVNIEVIQVQPEDIEMLRFNYLIYDSDTLIVALDSYRGQVLNFISGLKKLSLLNMKTVLVSGSSYHFRQAGGYCLSKCSGFSEFLHVFLLPRLSWPGVIRALTLSGRDRMLLEAFFRGVPESMIVRMTGSTRKQVSGYKILMLRKLGVRRFNHLFQIF